MADIIPKEALAYLKNKSLKPAFSYKDVWHEEHAAAFTVAKAMQLDVLSDLHTAVVDAMEKGQSFESFKKNIKPLLQQKGWWGKKEMTGPLTGKTVNAQLGSDRRLKTIYRVNMRSAYQKGQYERTMASGLHPYLMYRIGPSARHRKEHESWDGLILPKDDPWWDSHFPPNGWGCKCYTRAVTEARKKQYEGEGIPTAPRLDGTGGGNAPAKTKAPPVKYKTYFNERKGTVEQVPEGVDPAFNWNQGKAGNNIALQKLEASRQNYERAAAKIPEPKPRTVEEVLVNLGVKNIALANLSMETKQGICDCVQNIYSKLPEAKGAVSGIAVNNRLKTAYAQCTLNTGMIDLAGMFYKDVSKLKMSYERDLESLFHPAGTDYRSILTHEIGHVITGKISKKLGLTFREFGDKLEDEVLSELGLSKADIGINLSFYGRKNSLEFIAEAFAEYMDSKAPRRIALKVGEKLKSYLGGIK
jgi:SPP1 gp7 family putative phage head morphogenesis protein